MGEGGGGRVIIPTLDDRMRILGEKGGCLRTCWEKNVW